MNGKEFFTSYLPPILVKTPGIVAESGIRGKSVSLAIEGDAGGEWTVTFDASGNIALANGLGSPDCTVHMSDKTWEGVLTGSANIAMALFTRKIKIKGDPMLAAKLGSAFQSAMRKT